MVAPGLAARPALRFQRGDELELTLQNDLPVPGGAELARGSTGSRPPNCLRRGAPLAVGAKENLVIPSGVRPAPSCATLLPLADGVARPSRGGCP